MRLPRLGAERVKAGIVTGALTTTALLGLLQCVVQKMGRDMKLNYLQHTPRQLQKKCEKYLASVEKKKAAAEAE